MKEIDLDSLEYDSLESNVTKHISYTPNLFFGGKLINKNLRIDNKLSIINGGREKNSIIFLRKFIKKKRGRSDFTGTYFLYEYRGNRDHHYEAQESVRRFLTAVRIYKKTRCDVESDFNIEDSRKKKYYKPFDFPHEYLGNIYYGKDKTHILSWTELNKIKKIYDRLGEAKFSEVFYYSRLYNAVKFFNHSYDQHWTLLKVTLIFTALESLFSDSSKNEISYKVALRSSYFLYPKDLLKRKEVFNIIRRGYEIRSHFIHGSDAKKQENRIMNKFQKEKNVEFYSFHLHYIFDLIEVVSDCLAKILLEENYFNFFSEETHSPEKEIEFFDKLLGV